MATAASTPLAIGAGIWVLIVLAAVLLLVMLVTVARQMPELRRYRKIRSM